MRRVVVGRRPFPVLLILDLLQNWQILVHFFLLIEVLDTLLLYVVQPSLPGVCLILLEVVVMDLLQFPHVVQFLNYSLSLVLRQIELSPFVLVRHLLELLVFLLSFLLPHLFFFVMLQIAVDYLRYQSLWRMGLVQQDEPDVLICGIPKHSRLSWTLLLYITAKPWRFWCQILRSMILSPRGRPRVWRNYIIWDLVLPEWSKLLADLQVHCDSIQSLRILVFENVYGIREVRWRGQKHT